MASENLARPLLPTNHESPVAARVRQEDLRVSAACLRACNLAVVRFIGIQKMYGCGEDVFVFQEHGGSTSLCLPVSRANALAISYKVQQSRAQFFPAPPTTRPDSVEQGHFDTPIEVAL